MSDISVESVEQFQGQVWGQLSNNDTDTDLFWNQERKVINLATTRSSEEGHPRKSLGLLGNRERMNSQSFSFSTHT
jgi:superfamily I DNA and/or RNA helicase